MPCIAGPQENELLVKCMKIKKENSIVGIERIVASFQVLSTHSKINGRYKYCNAVESVLDHV